MKEKVNIDYNLIGNRLYTARTSKKITLEQAGNKIGVNKSTIQRWETGNVEKFKIPMLEALANLYGVSVEWIMGKNSLTEVSDSQNIIPIYDNLKYLKNDIIGEKILGNVYISSSFSPNNEFIAIKMNSNNMSPVILEDDIVIIQKQSDFKNSDIIAYIASNGNIEIRKVKEIPFGILLYSFNTECEPFVITNDDLSNSLIKIIGVVKRLERNFI